MRWIETTWSAAKLSFKPLEALTGEPPPAPAPATPSESAETPGAERPPDG